MRFLTDDRSQAIQIGAVLIFGILVVFLALYQGFVVPNQNEEIEFNHNQELQSEMTDMRSTAISMPERTTTQSVSIGLGVRYPSRAIFVNPGPASGTLQTSGTTSEAVNLTIENATADGNVGDFWDGTAREYDTGGIEYRPSYNLFATAPRTVYEHSVLFNDFGGETLSITGQALVREDRITLVTLNGSFSESRVGQASVDFQPVSTDTRTVEVSGTDDDPVTISVPTRLSGEEWSDLLDDEERVESVSTEEIPETDYSMLEVELETLEDDETYKLHLAKVGVGTGIEGSDAAYLTDTAGNGTTIQEDQTRTLDLEVRDEFNNPKSGVTVNGSAEGGEFTSSDDSTVTAETGGDGQIAVEYKGLSEGTNAINFSIASDYEPEAGEEHDAGTPKNVTMTVQVDALPESGDGLSAFNTTWEIETQGQDGFFECDDEDECDFEYNQTEAGGELPELDAETDPVTDGIDVDFGVEETDVATVSPETKETDDGEVSTTFQPQQEEDTNVYVWAGGTGDSINIDVIELTGPTINPDASEIDPDTTTEGESDSFTATVELENLEDVTEGDVTVTLVNYDGGDTDVEETENNADLSGDTATVTVDGGNFNNVDAPDASEYTVEASVDNFDGDADPIAPTQIDTITVVEEGQANLNIEDFSDELPDGETEPIEAGEEIAVDVTETSGDTDAEDVNIGLEIEEEDTGETIDIEQDTFTETIDAGETVTVTFGIAEEIDAGDYEATVTAENGDVNGDERTESFTVNEPAFFDVEITNTNSPVTEGETLNVDVDIENTGGVEDTQTIRLFYDESGDGVANEEVDSQEVENLSPEDETESITLEWDTEEGDAGEDIQINVTSDNDFATDSVTVDEDSVTGDGFASVTANDIDDGTQSLTMELDGSLASGETITIDLSEAEELDGDGPAEPGIFYSGNDDDVDIDSGTGTADFERHQENQEAVIKYTSDGDSDGDTIVISISNIDTEVAGQIPDDLEAIFQRSDADESATDTFGG